MSFLTPLWLALAGIVSAGLVLAHFFRRTVPPQDVLPTVRFVPEAAPLTVLRSRRLTNAGLLLLRLAAVALVGFALAGAHVAQRAPAQVVILDASRAVGAIAEVVDSALATDDGAVFIVADSAARHVPRNSLRALTRSSARGSLSAALAAAHRAIAGRAVGQESSELVIISPLVRESQDSATAQLVALWQGPVRVVRVRSGPDTGPSAWEVRGIGDDPVVAALGAARAAPATVRVVRIAPTGDDSAWARKGGALVLWPRDGASLLPRAAVDTQGAIAASRDVAVGSFARAAAPRQGTALVRWADGEPAATERAFGSGCLREVAIPVDPVGDVALGSGFKGIARTLVEPCGGARDYQVVTIASRPALTARAPPNLGDTGAGKLPLWLALGAASLLLIEQLVRNRQRVGAAA